jgi:hypothetical protein
VCYRSNHVWGAVSYNFPMLFRPVDGLYKSLGMMICANGAKDLGLFGSLLLGHFFKIGLDIKLPIKSFLHEIKY